MLGERGQICEVKEVFNGSTSAKLKTRYRFQVLILDITEKKQKYEVMHAIDSLNSMGYCTFDDVKDLWGEKKAKELIAFCEKNIKTKEK